MRPMRKRTKITRHALYQRVARKMTTRGCFLRTDRARRDTFFVIRPSGPGAHNCGYIETVAGLERFGRALKLVKPHETVMPLPFDAAWSCTWFKRNPLRLPYRFDATAMLQLDNP